MLSMMPVQLTEILSLSGESLPGGRAAPGLAAELAPDAATFADLLRRPLTATAAWPPAILAATTTPAADGTLPPGGNELPVAHLPDPLLDSDLAALLDGGAEAGSPDTAALLPVLQGPADGLPVSPVPLLAAEYRIDVRSGSSPALTQAGDAAARAGETLPASNLPQALPAASLPVRPGEMLPDGAVAERALPSAADELAALHDPALPSGAKEGAAGATPRPLPAFDAVLAALARDPAAVPAPDASAPTAQLTGGFAPPSAAPAAPSQAFQAAVGVPPGDPGWADAFGEQVVVLAGKQVQRAEIRLHPAELGPIHVQVTVEDDSTRLAFTAQHAVTRDAIEQALPRLRELFSGQGLSLGDTSVAGHGAQADRDTGAAARGFQSAVADAVLADEAGDVAPSQPAVARRTLVDVFA